MNWADRIKGYYDEGLWDIERVRNVVGKVLTEQEYEQITGKKY